MTTRKQRAHDTEQIAAGWFRANGWAFAEAVGAGRDGTDVTGMPGLLCEVKAERGWRPTTWLKQHALADVPAFVVARPDGYGPKRIGSWPVMMRLDDFTSLLRQAGYGTEE